MPKSYSPDKLLFNPVDLHTRQRKKSLVNKKKNEVLKKKGLKKDLTQSDLKIFGSEYFINYELSWLKFNWRVLAEAQNSSVPLLERVNFIGIVCSNLDEFFQKRVGGLKRQIQSGVTELTVDGRTPEEQIHEIRKVVTKMIKAYRDCYFKEIIPALNKEGIKIVEYKDLNERQLKKAADYFEMQLYPIITPLAVDEAHPFPFISNKSRSLAVKLKNPDSGEIHFARVKVPSNRPRWITLEEDEKVKVLVSISDIIKEKINRFFPGMIIKSANIFRVTRSADLEKSDGEAEDLLEMIEDELRERKFAEIVRLELDSKMPTDVKEYLINHLNIDEMELFEMNGPLGLADCTELYKLNGHNNLKFSYWNPTLHSALKHDIDQEKPDVFEVIRKGDFMVHHPYHSFESSTQRFVEDAANDPNVLAIKQTLYRTSRDSAVMHALIRAAEEGKQVAVLVELKARFDEERNISWAHKLEKAGVHVSYGVSGLKIHTKLTMVVREEEKGLRRYVHVGTGNYHPDTAQLYEDLGYFTCREDIASDITDLFNLLTGYAPDQKYNRLLVAPKYMRKKITELIDIEIKAARQNNPARIIAKMNSLEDPLIIQKLYEAAQVGVKIDLIVRGVCRLIPGKKGLSENIKVHAIVGRFLEHSRCYYFNGNGEDHYFVGSADWMHRNLDARVEVLVPIVDNSLKKYLQFLFNLYLKDNQQRWLMNSKGNYIRVKKKSGERKLSAHDVLMSHMKDGLAPLPQSVD